MKRPFGKIGRRVTAALVGVWMLGCLAAPAAAETECTVHAFGLSTVTRAATSSSTGRRAYVCTVCGKTEYETYTLSARTLSDSATGIRVVGDTNTLAPEAILTVEALPETDGAYASVVGYLSVNGETVKRAAVYDLALTCGDEAALMNGAVRIVIPAGSRPKNQIRAVLWIDGDGKVSELDVSEDEYGDLSFQTDVFGQYAVVSLLHDEFVPAEAGVSMISFAVISAAVAAGVGLFLWLRRRSRRSLEGNE